MTLYSSFFSLPSLSLGMFIHTVSHIFHFTQSLPFEYYTVFKYSNAALSITLDNSSLVPSKVILRCVSYLAYYVLLWWVCHPMREVWLSSISMLCLYNYWMDDLLHLLLSRWLCTLHALENRSHKITTSTSCKCPYKITCTCTQHVLPYPCPLLPQISPFPGSKSHSLIPDKSSAPSITSSFF